MYRGQSQIRYVSTPGGLLATGYDFASVISMADALGYDVEGVTNLLGAAEPAVMTAINKSAAAS